MSGNLITESPVGTVKTTVSASFFTVRSEVEPCPVSINPSAAVYPMAALSPAAVSESGSKVEAVAAPVTSTPVEVVAILAALS